MSVTNIAQPDVKLVLDESGTIRDASVSRQFLNEDVSSWLGQRWQTTVGDTSAEKVEAMLRDARVGGVCDFREVNQRFPSGLEIPMEYTMVWLGGPQASALVVGRNLRVIAEMQSRLVSVQQALERDYWKMRDVETRYRQLFEASNEAVILLDSDDRIIEINPAAIRALGRAALRPERVVGRSLLDDIVANERPRFQAMLARSREQGKAPGVTLHLGPQRHAWIVRASLIRADGQAASLLQLAPAAGTQPDDEQHLASSITALLLSGPDPLVVLDREGAIRACNGAFVELVQMASEATVVGQRLERWLAGPVGDLGVLLANLRRFGQVRRFPLVLRGELGSETSVELSAFTREPDSDAIGMLLREVGDQPASAASDMADAGALQSLTGQVGTVPMRKLVRETVAMVERHIVRTALEMTQGNRTAAAELLGLSRQSLYAKLARYGLDAESTTHSEPRS